MRDTQISYLFDLVFTPGLTSWAVTIPFIKCFLMMKKLAKETRSLKSYTYLLQVNDYILYALYSHVNPIHSGTSAQSPHIKEAPVT